MHSETSANGAVIILADKDELYKSASLYFENIYRLDLQPPSESGALKSSERGYSLLELVLALGLMMLWVGVAVMVARSGLVRMGTYAEARESNDRAVNLSALMAADLDACGLNMTQLSTEASGTESLLFEAHQDYSPPQPGVIVKQVGGTFPALLSTRVLGGGTGVLSFSVSTPTSGGIGFRDAGGNVCSIAFDTTNPALRTWAVFENGAYIPTPMSVSGHPYALFQSGDAFTIEIINKPDGTRGVGYFLIRSGQRRLVYTSTQPALTYPVAVSAGIVNTGGSFSNIFLTGAPLADRILQERNVAAMPRSADGEMRFPISLHYNPATSNADGFLFLRGDVAVDVMRLTNNFDARVRGHDRGQLIAGIPTRGQVIAGDRLLVIDYAAGRSLLLFVTEREADIAGTVESAPAQSLVVVPVADANRDAGWNGLFWSSEADKNYTYPAGSVLVKLAAPVEYRWNGSDTLLRREGDQAWAIAAAGVTDFSLSERLTDDSYSLRVTAMMLSDSAFSSADRERQATENFEATFAPRALNSSYRR